MGVDSTESPTPAGRARMAMSRKAEEMMRSASAWSFRASAAAWAVCGLVARVLSGHSAYGANALATFCGILAGVVVYGVLVITLRILQAEDVKALPKGEKIAKLLRLK